MTAHAESTVKRKTSRGSREIKGRGGKSQTIAQSHWIMLGKMKKTNTEGRERGGWGCPVPDLWEQRNISEV